MKGPAICDVSCAHADIPRYVMIFASLLRGRIVAPVKFIFRRKDGSQGWAEGHCRLVKVGDQEKEIILIARDMSVIKKIKEEQSNLSISNL